MRISATFTAFTALLLFILLQALFVTTLFDGNWTGLFLSGDRFPLPDSLAATTYRWKASPGYDAQFYRLVAHDPFFQKPVCAACFDIVAFRYQRILVPVLAWAAAFGRQEWIDWTYIGVIAGFVWLGTWALARYAQLCGASVLWGWLFVLLPSTLIGLQRLTVDVALAALCALLLYARQRPLPGWAQWSVLALACLARDTGVLLVAATGLVLLSERRWRDALLAAAAPLPALGWVFFVAQKTSGLVTHSDFNGPVPKWLFEQPVAGLLLELGRLAPRGGMSTAGTLAASLDVLALAGVLLAMVLAFWFRPRLPLTLFDSGAVMWALLILVVSTPPFWEDVNGWGRPLSPLFLFLGVRTLQGRSWLFLVPLVVADLRVGFEFLVWGAKALAP